MTEPALLPEQLAVVQHLLASHAPGREWRVFGSRATGRRLKPWSDLDLVAMGDEPVPSAQLSRLAEAFDASDLPFRVDLLAWCDAPAALRTAIERESLPLMDAPLQTATGRVAAG